MPVSKVQCMDCKEDVWFPSAQALRYHRKTDHGPKTHVLTCYRCFGDFTSRSELGSHACQFKGERPITRNVARKNWSRFQEPRSK